MRGVALGLAFLVAACGGSERPDREAVMRGQKVFATCAACHSVRGAAGVGPALNGVVGRTAGTLPGFAYSGALKGSGLVWTEEALVAFLQDPGSIAGINMAITPLSEADARDVVQYLKSL
jgi:cytochrome c